MRAVHPFTTFINQNKSFSALLLAHQGGKMGISHLPVFPSFSDCNCTHESERVKSSLSCPHICDPNQGYVRLQSGFKRNWEDVISDLSASHLF